MRYLIIDGHSVIFSWPELRKMHAKRTALARDTLVKIFTQYQDASGVHVVVVFDGKGDKSSEERSPGGIQVFYSAAGKTADDIIERLVARYGSEHDLTVATSDRLEQQTAISFGANVVSAEQLRTFVTEAETDMARRLKVHRRK